MIPSKRTFLLLPLIAVLVSGKVIFSETFDTNWHPRWNVSRWQPDRQGAFVHCSGKLNLTNMSLGIMAANDSRFYAISSRVVPPIKMNATLIVIQYSMRFEQFNVCGGGYVKLLAPGFNQSGFGAESHSLVTFGPDVCSTNNRIQLLLDAGGRGEMWKKAPEAPADRLTHFYTLALHPNGTYSVYVDSKLREHGEVAKDWDLDYETTVRKFVVGGVGLDVWQAKAGTLFDNIMITDNLSEALEYAEGFLKRQVPLERELVRVEEAGERAIEEESRRIHDAAPKERLERVDFDEERDDL